MWRSSCTSKPQKGYNDGKNTICRKACFICGAGAVCAAGTGGCSLFADSSSVKLGDSYTHKDPKDLSYDKRTVLRKENFGASLADIMSSDAYPDTMYYDDEGNAVGIYDYDEDTGLAKGWTDFTDGTYTEFPQGEEVDLGKPDQSKIVEIPGDVTLYIVAYGSKDQPVAAYYYLMLSDQSAKETVETGMEDCYGLTFTAESDTVLTAQQDEKAIAQELDSYGIDSAQQTMDTYQETLMQNYGAREYTGVNPYKPYDGHKDPTDLTYDKRVVLTGSAAAAVEEQYAGDVTSLTDYVYGSEGKVVGQYTYLECTSKEAADKLMDAGVYPNGYRVSDTVIGNVLTGTDLDNTVSAYIGYNVLKDNSLDEYVRMIEETYFSEIYEESDS